MELKWLEDFVTLAETGSFTRSARKRNITQPAFSRRIKALEHWIGVTLVDRNTFPLSLTPAGRRLYETATHILQRIHHDRSELRAQEDEDRFVAFAAPHSLATYFFPRFLARVEPHAKSFRTRLTTDNLHECVDSLEHAGCDFLIAFHHDQFPLIPNPERYLYRTLLEDQLIPVCALLDDGGPAYRLPETGDVQAPVLAYDPNAYLGHVVTHLLSGRRAALRNVIYENALTEALKVMALAQRGIAWLPQHCIEPELGDGTLLTAGGLEWQMPLEIRIYRSATNTKPAIERIWQACEAAFASTHAHYA